MPSLNKEALSQFFRTECHRQLRLYLSPHNTAYMPERLEAGMPDPQPPRPGLDQFRREGDKWQEAKLHDLTETFGPESIVGDARYNDEGRVRYRPISLSNALEEASAGHFIVEAQFELRVGSDFESSLGITSYRDIYNLDYSELRPDIIEVLAPNYFSEFVTSSGEIERLSWDDQRLQLRVIDIKLASEPSTSHFAEVTYYTMTLAGWLIDQGLQDRFVVVPNGAVWPGSHDASKLVVKNREILLAGGTPTYDDLFDAMQEDLEAVPFQVFAFRLRRFLQNDIPEVLDPEKPWRTLEWHVDNRCKGCENLGYDWGTPASTPREDHCIPTALRQSHLSRVAFMPRGARKALELQNVTTVAALAGRSATDPVFGVHHVLRATSTVVSTRAESLETGVTQIAPHSGTSAMLPRWSDLNIYISADFDIGSAITVAFGVSAFWKESLPYDPHGPLYGPYRMKQWKAAVFTVDQKDMAAEEREFLNFLSRIHEILKEVKEQSERSTMQIYVWDSLQYEHLARVTGRHLQSVLLNATLRHLAWLFPPEDLLPDPDTITRQSPITIVQEVVRSLLSAAIPHYYSLLGVARMYHPETLPPAMARFNVHPYFEDPLSDQIPSERTHEIWSRSGDPHWSVQLETLKETVAKKLVALDAVRRRLRSDLKELLGQTAPKINLELPDRQFRLSVDGQLWYAFARLNAALDKLEAQQIWAMPTHEREARFNSARLNRRLTGEEEQNALNLFSLNPQPNRYVYTMRAESCEVKLREHDFDCAICPEVSPDFLSKKLISVTRGTPLEHLSSWGTTMAEVMGVTVRGIDRDQRVIVLDVNSRWADMVAALEAQGLVDLSADVILDPTSTDFFTKKLLEALKAIGNPSAARTPNTLVQRATGQLTGRGPRISRHTPPADLLWGALAMHNTPVERDLPLLRASLMEWGIRLNHTQWEAWEEALTRRLCLVWGPPGTGKSRTARAIILGAVLDAFHQGQPLRLLICASTYKAVDNVLLDVYEYINYNLPFGADVAVRRLRSKYQPPAANVPDEIDVELNRYEASNLVHDLRNRIINRRGITVVASTPEQVYNLLVLDDSGSAQQEFFDLIVIDEASQMDVAHAILPLCALAADGGVILTGDTLQLPPIHQAEPPLQLEAMVGSIYTFCKELHQVPDKMLDVNYRSNSTLVDFYRNAGYEYDLRSYSPELKLHLTRPFPTGRPANWPLSLFWTTEWAQLLDPEKPAVSFVYSEGYSSQWNRFEADAVASLIVLLYRRLSNQLLNERDPETGEIIMPTGTEYTAAEFWEKAIGVVTPHRAQQGLITSRLQSVFSHSHDTTPLMIRDAIDTVERFQGQQRDVIIASFSLGDPDAISNEDEFLMSLHRFNVMASRARAKLIVLISQQVVDHLSNDLNTLRTSHLIKSYTESFCRNQREMTLGRQENGTTILVPGLYKYR